MTLTTVNTPKFSEPVTVRVEGRVSLLLEPYDTEIRDN